MAVSQMKKVQLSGYAPLKERVIETLMSLGCVHILDSREEFIESGISKHEAVSQITTPSFSGIPISSLEEDLSQLEYIINFTANYSEKAKGLSILLSPERITLSSEEIGKIRQKTDVSQIYSQCLDLENRMIGLQLEMSKKQDVFDELSPWQNFDAALQDLQDTAMTTSQLVIAKRELLSQIQEEIGKTTTGFELRIINENRNTAYLFLLMLRDDASQILAILDHHGCKTIRFEGIINSPAEEMRQIQTELSVIDKEKIKIKEEWLLLAKDNRDNVLVLHDLIFEDIQKRQVEAKFAHTRCVFFVNGWIKTRDEMIIRRELEKISPELDITTLSPKEDEHPPVALENNSYVSPFEVVTILYSRPNYREFDPTPFFVPFFIIFFGCCITDVGYGVILTAVALFLLKRFKPTGDGARLIKIILWGGMSTIVIGVLTGGWFGIDVAVLPQLLQNMVVLNPIENPLDMLKLALVLGIIQIFTGIIIKACANIRDKRFIDVLLDQVLWIIMLVFLLPMGYSVILGGKVSPDIAAAAGKGASITAIALILTQGRANKSVFGKLFGGVISLYNVVGYFGNVLSYARLLALGLATSAIAMTINGVAKMATEIPYLGYVLAILILIGGHTFNIVITTLGGFVHSSRLQFLEFFSNFFKGGGQEFKPFERRNRYIDYC
ncbi:MAG: V-type ATPase 116kDa subunit family protein [bacterium]|nr:V-type ATPase 116kDa subunit family protein [bacterium]